MDERNTTCSTETDLQIGQKWLELEKYNQSCSL